MKTNTKAVDRRVDAREESRLAGGFGSFPAAQDSEALLRRAVMACLLWEDLFYESGESGAENIRALIHQVDLEKVARIASEARNVQKLRHIPLFIVREMARHPQLKENPSLVSKTLVDVIHRADELSEFLALYWKDGRAPLSAQIKRGLARAFGKFNEYHFAKYNRESAIKLRDVLFLSHSKPDTQAREDLYKRLIDGKLQAPDTWEVALSGGANKAETFERLVSERKLGALAFLRNLRNMVDAGVSRDCILEGFRTVRARWLLPINYLSAAKYAPRYEREIEDLMLRGFSQVDKLPGYTVFVVDVSGSMGSGISGKSEFNRLDVACAMAMMAEATCERVSIYATAGNDSTRIHQTALVPARRGFGLMETIKAQSNKLGGGGIFTRQCLEYIKTQEKEAPDRIIIFSDSQDCDLPGKQTPAPFGKRNYIVDVSAHSRGVNYKGIWTAEVSGWSEHFIDYIAALEGLNWTQNEESAI